MKAIHSKINEHLQWTLCQLKLSSNKYRLTVSFLYVFKVEHDVCFAGEFVADSSQLHVSAISDQIPDKQMRGLTQLTLTLTSTCSYSVDVVATCLSYPFLNNWYTCAIFISLRPCPSAATRASNSIYVSKGFSSVLYTWPWYCQLFRQLLGNSTIFHHLPATTRTYSWLRLRMRSDRSYLNWTTLYIFNIIIVI